MHTLVPNLRLPSELTPKLCVLRGSGVIMHISHVPDEELRALAKREGPKSPASDILQRLVRKRLKDHQVHVWRLGQYYFVGPIPDARTELQMIELVTEDESEG
jgi:hypothetical protein